MIIKEIQFVTFFLLQLKQNYKKAHISSKYQTGQVAKTNHLIKLYIYIKLIQTFLPSLLLLDLINSLNCCGVLMKAYCCNNSESETDMQKQILSYFSTCIMST